MFDSQPHPRRVGIVLNPQSGRVRRNLQHLRHLTAEIPGARTHEAVTPQQISDAIDELGLNEQDLLVVVGGDGSLQAALTAIMTRQPDALPSLLVVPAGTTNMSAADLGSRATPVATLQALIRWLNHRGCAPRSCSRAVLKIVDSGHDQAQVGLFFGVGAIVTGVRYFHSTVRPTGVRGVLGPGLAFIRMLASLFSKGPHRLLPATAARLNLASEAISRDWLLILATTLDTLLLGSKPYWGAERAPMHLTGITHRPPRLLAALPGLLRGKPNKIMSEHPAYISHNLSSAAIEDLDEYLLDGEIFTVQGKIHVSATSRIRFVSL